MQINKIGINNIGFQANFVRVDKIGNSYHFTTILTDNEENLGKEPVLEYERDNVVRGTVPMTYDGKYYTTEVVVFPDKYRILYKDTGKYERNGVKQTINPLDYTKIAAQYDRKYNKLPLEYSIAKGDAEGKVFVNTFDIPKNIPAILILDEIRQDKDIMLKIPDNVKCLITSKADTHILSHNANLARNKYQVLSVILDDEKFNELKNQEGKTLYINNENGFVEYKKIGAVNKTKIRPKQTVEIPKLENVERLLTYDELTPQTCGNKGYRLSLIQKLIREGKLKDIQLPQGFVIPEGYINKLKQYIDEDNKIRKNRFIGYTQEVEQKVAELGMSRNCLITRSNYNDEDLGSYSSAGIYESRNTFRDDNILVDALGLIREAENSDLAQYVHNKSGVKDSQIQPSVIVQDYIKQNYNFTVYSDDGDNNTIIQLTDLSKGLYRPDEKALIKFNKNTKELTIANNETSRAKYLIDEKGHIIDQYHEKSSITENWDILAPLLGIVTSGALVLEKFFKHPQDIEGGIGKDGKVYFWQTRDIVAKGKKKI